tara:strand:- start:699 stop:1571 length:873 start_codon:yes stop_codon:yes gene_type:complete
MVSYWPNGSLSIPTVTSEYNPARRNPVTGVVQPHRGIDLVGFVDNCSPVDGTVIFAGYNGPAGNEVRIRADGPTAFHKGDCFRLLHNARLYVSTGQRVQARQPVGRMGTTGQSTGVHCHFETHDSWLWNYVNPRDFMAAANRGVAGGGATSFEEDDMRDDERQALFTIRDELRELLPGKEGVRNQGATNKLFIEMYTTIRGMVRSVWAFPVKRGGGSVSAIQELADAKTNTIHLLGREPGAVDVDESALAGALAPLLADQLGALSDADVKRLAEAVAEEQGRRLSGGVSA